MSRGGQRSSTEEEEEEVVSVVLVACGALTATTTAGNHSASQQATAVLSSEHTWINSKPISIWHLSSSSNLSPSPDNTNSSSAAVVHTGPLQKHFRSAVSRQCQCSLHQSVGPMHFACCFLRRMRLKERILVLLITLTCAFLTTFLVLTTTNSTISPLVTGVPDATNLDASSIYRLVILSSKKFESFLLD